MVGTSGFRLVLLATPVKRDHLVINNYIKSFQVRSSLALSGLCAHT